MDLPLSPDYTCSVQIGLDDFVITPSFMILEYVGIARLG